MADVVADQLGFAKLGFDSVNATATGRPAYHPAMPLKLYIYGYSEPHSIEPAS